jgi:hypothetical protein
VHSEGKKLNGDRDKMAIGDDDVLADLLNCWESTISY